jgi:hypothetical protein
MFGIVTSKTLLTLKLKTGSTAAGEVFPPHIQFQPKAKSVNTTQIDVYAAEHK